MALAKLVEAVISNVMISAVQAGAVETNPIATLLGEAGLTARQVADLLGHSRVSMTKTYFGRGQQSRASAEALAFVVPVEGPGEVGN